jgi:hypothetical protein
MPSIARSTIPRARQAIPDSSLDWTQWRLSLKRCRFSRETKVPSSVVCQAIHYSVSVRCRGKAFFGSTTTTRQCPPVNRRALLVSLFLKGSLQQQQFLRGNEIARLEPIEVHSAGKTRGVELDLMITSFLFSILEDCNLLAECVEDVQLDC